MLRLSDEVALITGGGSGMGRAGALRFAAEGASVVVADINEDAARDTVRLVEEAGGKATAVRTDISVAADNARAVAAATDAFGKLSIVWANAGIPHASTPIDDLDSEEFDRIFAVNARGPWLTAQAAIPALRANGGGAIVFTGSLSGLKARAGNSIYASSKGAVVMLTRVLAVELAPEIRVNCVNPVATDTPMLPSFMANAPDPAAVREALTQAVPLKRLATAEDIANAALFLVSSEAAMITGVNLPIDGGSSA
ncbi:MAG: SDR family NAD(P)-dependent oxidoreductase [Gaiellaceae bacterium]